MGGREKKNYDLPTRPRPPVATLTRRSASRLAHHSDLAGHHHHHDKAVRCLVYSPATLPQMEEGEKEDMKKIRLTEKKNQKKTNPTGFTRARRSEKRGLVRHGHAAQRWGY